MAKRSRRARRQESERRRKATPNVPSPPQPASEVEVDVASEIESAEPVFRGTKANFAREYFYVYKELQAIAVVAVVMFIILVGLSFVI